MQGWKEYNYFNNQIGFIDFVNNRLSEISVREQYDHTIYTV